MSQSCLDETISLYERKKKNEESQTNNKKKQNLNWKKDLQEVRRNLFQDQVFLSFSTQYRLSSWTFHYHILSPFLFPSLLKQEHYLWFQTMVHLTFSFIYFCIYVQFIPCALRKKKSFFVWTFYQHAFENSLSPSTLWQES